MSSNPHKTISINKSYFTLGGSKTRKNREKPSKPANIPIISPNVLKNKLLKRIKEHKQRETQNLDCKKKAEFNINESLKQNQEGSKQFSDEFNDSINYLQSLTKQKRMNEERKQNEEEKQARRAELERRTLKNYHSLAASSQQTGVSSSMPMVNLDLPAELQQVEPTIHPYTEPFKINNPSVVNSVPYGVLKGGTKPTYRQWAKTQRNNVVMDPNASVIINSQMNARENRLRMLKEKIKRKNMDIAMDPMLNENMIKKNVQPQPSVSLASGLPMQSMQPIQPIQPMQTMQPIHTMQPIQTMQPSKIPPETGHIVATKHITKKTIKRKYSLGRSNIKRKVSVLIKDKGTRKKVISAQKELKRRNINDVKEYLRKHNLWTLGSNAPNDVLRQMYECAMLSGEITNNNTETLLHNLTKEDKEL